MKRRICFVNDDPREIKSLEPALAGMGDAWDSTFVASGNAALRAMAAQPFDGVIAKMRLPGLSGAKLLQEVGRLHPKTVRYILGDIADREIIVNCIGGAHQFISNHCNPQELINTVQRSLALDAWLSTDQLRALVPRLRRLPSLPSTYFEVLKQIESPNAGARNIGEVIGRDPAVMARVLQMANSAGLALGQKMTNAVDAVSLLGVETVKSLVLCLQVFTQNDQAKQAGLSFERLWTHSLAVARIARYIMLLESKDDRKAGDAFTAGLLHDVGRIVIASNLPQEYAAVLTSARENKRLLYEEESSQLGVTHAQIGAYLLGLWGMPAQLVESAALHHVPDHASTRDFSLLTAVHAADVFAHEKDPDTDGIAPPKFNLEYLTAVGVADKLDAWRKTAVEKPAPSDDKPAPAAAVPAPAQVDSIIAKTKAASKVKAAPPPVTTHVPVPSRRIGQRLGWMVGAGAAVIVLALVLGLNRRDSAGGIQAQARTADAVPAPAAAPPASAPKEVPVRRTVEISPFDSVKVQAIFYRLNNPSVVINGKTLGLGERVNGVEVVFIGQTNVVLAYRNERKMFRMKSK